MKLARTLAGVLVALVLLGYVSLWAKQLPCPAVFFCHTHRNAANLSRSGPLRILNLQGTYGDMGRQYGALLKNETARVVRPRRTRAIGLRSS